MASARTRVLQLVEPSPADSPFAAPVEVDLGGEAAASELRDGALVTENADGSATVDLDPKTEAPADLAFDANLAIHMDADRLSQIAENLLQGIQVDDDSRREWLATRARGITLLGLNLEEPRGDAGTSADTLSGISTIHHPALLEATIRFQATARGELLPAAGPVKVRNDSTVPPPVVAVPPGLGHNGGPPLDPASAAPAPVPPGAGAMPAQPSPSPPGAPAPFAAPSAEVGAPPPQPPGVPGPAMGPPQSRESTDDLATALEKDFNHYLTSTATEYVPDTDRMLFYVGFGGDGFKKVFNCPLRRRPVSESVDAEDIIVSNAATDLKNCIRVTHQIRMRPALLRRMQILGAYRDVPLQTPEIPQITAVDQKKAEIQAMPARPQRPEDGSYTVYECYCELDIDEFAPAQFKGKGLPLPYKVTIEKQSRQVLEIRRNWKDDDPQCLARQYFVQFPFIRGLGFYGIGYIHVLGNLTVALTALYREMIDAGMFANFPGFLTAKGLSRQNSNQLRVAPGTGFPIDLNGLDDIRKAVMALPYKEPGGAFAQFIIHVEEVAQRLGQTANITVGEGKQDAPVGTTLALIEQATKMVDSVHKRLHAAQAEEFALLKDRFRDDPEAFWRHNKTPTMPWQREQFLKALDTYGLVPVSDPNNPTSLHRIAKAAALKELQKASPTLYNPYKVDTKVMRIVGLDAEDTMNPVPANPPPDPRFEAIKQKAQAQERQATIQQSLALIKAATAHDQLADKAADRESRERIETMRLINEMLDLEQSRVIHARDAEADDANRKIDMYVGLLKNMVEMQMKDQQHQQRLSHGQELHEARLKQQRNKAKEKTDA